MSRSPFSFARRGLLPLAIALAPTLSAMANTDGLSASAVKIGMVNVQTGPAAGLGKGMRSGAEAVDVLEGPSFHALSGSNDHFLRAQELLLHRAPVDSIDRVIDTSDLSSKGADKIERNGAGEVVLRTKRMLALDEHLQNPITGRFVLVEDYMPMGGGIVSMDGYPDQRELKAVSSKLACE